MGSLLLCALTSACGTTGSVAFDVVEPKSYLFAFRDERPAHQRTATSVRTGSSTIDTFGDDSFTPAPQEILRRYLHDQLGAELSGATLVLTSFVVTVAEPDVVLDPNRFAMAMNSVPNPNPLGVILAAPVIWAIERTRNEKTVTVEVGGRVGDTDFSAAYSERFSARVTEANVRTALGKALEQTAHQVRSAIRRGRSPSGDTERDGGGHDPQAQPVAGT